MYTRLLVLSTLLYALVLWVTRYGDGPDNSLRLAIFHAVSMQTTSGFVIDNFSQWPGALPVILMLTRFHRRLRRVHLGRHEGSALAPHLATGSARGHTARTSEC